MILETVSRQLWSSLKTWLRKPQMVVTGLNRRSRYRTPCSSRASRMLRWVKESAKGSPWSRAKRARTSSRLVMGGLKRLWCEWGGPRKRRGGPSRAKGARAAIASHLHCTRRELATHFVRNFIRGQPLRLCLQHSSITPTHATLSATGYILLQPEPAKATAWSLPEHLHGHPGQALATGRVDLAGHDQGTRLVLRDFQFCEACAQAGW